MTELSNETWHNYDVLLLGFQDLYIYKYPIFFLFLCSFMMTCFGNLLVIFLASTSNLLTSPMYFFLIHLSTTDVLVSLSTAPLILINILEEGIIISFKGCILQMFLFCLPEEVQCLVLALMSYDRYLAICKPLHYNSIMDRRFQYNIIGFIWMSGFALVIFLTIQMNNLKFCRQPEIDHIFCDSIEFVMTSCSNTYVIKLENFITSVFVTGFSLTLIVATYARILLTIFRISNTSGRQKVFSTCSSHFLVVSLYYGSLVAVYGASTKHRSGKINSGLSLLYCSVTPLLNPIIYSLRSQEVKLAFRQLLNKCCAQHL
uniref:G-protein coupled receptors family 1 profile domain-containing protein n=1 Tax=Pyxicephalus adspersus TaxID=30357 RepID=A0AAV3AVV5_PYXAD|nr:TPA: hypothetical protein GDO54_005765 [Pyxicephalus adspersus]